MQQQTQPEAALHCDYFHENQQKASTHIRSTSQPNLDAMAAENYQNKGMRSSSEPRQGQLKPSESTASFIENIR